MSEAANELPQYDANHEEEPRSHVGPSPERLRIPVSPQRTGIKVLMVLLPLLMIAGGVGVKKYLESTKPEPEKVEKKATGLLVETQTALKEDRTVSLRARGTVIAAQQVAVSAEVGGRVLYMNENLVPGGKVKKGATLFRVDGRDYALQLAQSSAEVNRAQLELEMERSRGKVAQKEWQTFGGGKGDAALARREPQLRTATVGVKAASSARSRARLSLSKTKVKAPFNAMVVNEAIEKGQLVGPQSMLATLVGTDEFWVQVSVPVASLSSIRINEKDGSAVTVWNEIDGQRIEREGHVIRLLPDLDPSGSMARVIVAIDDPLGLETGGVPLLLGSFVTVDINVMSTLNGVIPVARQSVHEGDQVYVLAEGNVLEVREVKVAWATRDEVLIRDGLAPGEEIIVSRVPTAVTGMKLRKASDEKAKEGSEKSTKKSEENTEKASDK